MGGREGVTKKKVDLKKPSREQCTFLGIWLYRGVDPPTMQSYIRFVKKSGEFLNSIAPKAKPRSSGILVRCAFFPSMYFWEASRGRNISIHKVKTKITENLVR